MADDFTLKAFLALETLDGILLPSCTLRLRDGSYGRRRVSLRTVLEVVIVIVVPSPPPHLTGDADVSDR